MTPNEAAELPGTSRPPAGHRMDIGELPFRYAGKHPRIGFAGVVALKVTLDEQGSPLRELAEDPNELAKHYRVFSADRGLGLLRALSIRAPQPFSSGVRGSAVAARWSDEIHGEWIRKLLANEPR